MKKYCYAGILLLLVFISGFGLWRYIDSEEEKETGHTENSIEETVAVYRTEEEFAEAVVTLINKYDDKYPLKEELLNPYYSKRLIVQGTDKEPELTGFGAETVIGGPDNLYVLQFQTEEKAEEVNKILQNLEGVEYCEPDQYSRISEEPEFSEPMSWGVEKTGANSLAKYIQEKSGRELVVAVVDTGVNEHPFLDRRIADGGRDFVNGDLTPDDQNSHGTHVAGTIVDCTPGLNVMVLPVKVLGEDGWGSWLQIRLGIRYAVDQGAEIINLSLGGDVSQTVDHAVEYALMMDCIVVAAAGNDNRDTKTYSPAHIGGCIVVAAVDSINNKAEFSNWGQSVDFAAPGVGIDSCSSSGQGTKRMNGTSMAAPHISALAAMLKLETPSLTSSEIEQKLAVSCVDLGEEGWDLYYGWGIPAFTDILSSVPNESEQTGDTSAYDDVLREYRQAAKNEFDYEALETLRYVNLGAANLMGYNEGMVYYRYTDLDGDGGMELLIAATEDDVPENIIDIYSIVNGIPVRVIDNDFSVGYRNRYYITENNFIKNISSGGALDSFVTYYRLIPGEKMLEPEEQYVYNGWDGDVYTYINENGEKMNISAEDFGYYSDNYDVDYETPWKLLSEWGDNNTGNVETGIKDELQSETFSAYQGVFMNGDVFISILLYSSYEQGEAIGIIYQVTKPERDANGYVNSDIIKTVGEIYAPASGKEYEVKGENVVSSLMYYNKEILMSGNSAYDGSYVQVSNSGANMSPKDIWLDVQQTQQDTAEKEAEPEYIISNSGNSYLTEEEVMSLNLSLREINYAKNEIYARKGRKFRSIELQNYFNSKSWYNPMIEPDNFLEVYLNEYEAANAELLSEIEYSLSPNGYQLDQ